MSEKQALILTFAVSSVAMAAAMVGIKLLGGGPELMACVIPLFVCVGAWEVAGVVVRYAGKEGQRRRG